MPVRRLLLAALVVVAAAVGVAVGRSGDDGELRDLLPDLDQAVPQAVAVIEQEEGLFVLTFGSAVDNVGDGPLVIDARRSSRAQRDMRVTQVIDRSDGSRRRLRVPGVVRYIRSETHQHWHLLDFDRYELRRAADNRLVVPDAKTGFCLGDRYKTSQDVLPGEPDNPVFATDCGKNLPRLLALREGISVGYGDDYVPTLEGQYLDLTGVPGGRYLLVHRANPDRTLRERSFANNAASMLLRLTRPRGAAGAPRVVILARCPDTATCAEPS
jgi:hypothetical protein